MNKETKSEKRERIKKNRSKMSVDGSSVKLIHFININKAKQARDKIYDRLVQKKQRLHK